SKAVEGLIVSCRAHQRYSDGEIVPGAFFFATFFAGFLAAAFFADFLAAAFFAGFLAAAFFARFFAGRRRGGLSEFPLGNECATRLCPTGFSLYLPASPVGSK